MLFGESGSCVTHGVAHIMELMARIVFMGRVRAALVGHVVKVILEVLPKTEEPRRALGVVANGVEGSDLQRL